MMTETLSAETIEEIRAAAQREGQAFIQALETRCELPPELWLEALGRHFHYPVLEMAALDRLEPAFDLLSLREATQRLCVILRDGADRWLCAMVDPTDQFTIEAFQMVTGRTFVR